MKTPAELAARLRKMVLAAQHHYSPTGEPLRSIVVSPEWLEDMADAANALDVSTFAMTCETCKHADQGDDSEPCGSCLTRAAQTQTAHTMWSPAVGITKI